MSCWPTTENGYVTWPSPTALCVCSCLGSAARGEDDAKSDLDLLVEIPPERLHLFDLLELGHEVSDAPGVEVDIGTPDMLKPAIRDQVLAEAHPL